MKEKTIITITAIIVIGILEAIAIYVGIDGTLLMLVFAAIAGMAGYGFGKKPETAILAGIGFSIEIDFQSALIIIAGLGIASLIYLGYRLSQLPQMVMKGVLGSIARLARSTGTGDDAEAFANLGSSLERAWKGDDTAILSVLTNPLTVKAWQKLQPIVQKLTGQAKLSVNPQEGGFVGD